MTDTRFILKRALEIENSYSLAFPSSTMVLQIPSLPVCLTHTIEFLTAVTHEATGGLFESNILRCVTSHFFPSEIIIFLHT